jgi:uncharacterized protein (TIGR02466 family)
MHQLEPAERDRLNGGIRAKLSELMEKNPSVDGEKGFQTVQDLHTLPEFQEFNRVILAAGKGVMDFLHVAEQGIEITSCWANINPTGARNAPHTHPNNYLGGVYYVDVPDNADNIVFQDPRPQAHVLSPRVSQSTSENSGRAIISVEEGMLLLFPAWLTHHVPPNPTGHTRISVSFNLMFSAFTETVSPVKWQGNLPTS